MLRRAVVVLILAAGACEPSSTSVVDVGPIGEAWAEGNATRIAPNAIQLLDGSCLDASRLPEPWEVEEDRLNNTIAIQARGSEIGVRPDDRPGFPGEDGMLRLLVSGWSRPPDEISRWFVASPERIDANIASGMLKRVPHPANALGLESFAGPGDNFAHVDPRRYTQCRDYGETPVIHCAVVSDDGQYWFSASVSTAERAAVADRLITMLRATDAMRGECPAGPN